MKRNLRFWGKIVVWVICVTVYALLFIQQTLFAPLSPTDIIIVSLTPLLIFAFGMTISKLLFNHNPQSDKTKQNPSHNVPLPS